MLRAKISYRSMLVLRIVLLFSLGFLLISVVAWLFFRNEVRQIGYYLRFGRSEQAAQLIGEYLEDPPSRFRARILAQTYGLNIMYSRGNTIVWVVEEWRIVRPGRPAPREITPMMRMMREGRGNHFDRTMVYRFELEEGGDLSIRFPPPMFRMRHFTPLYIFAVIAALIGLILFISIRRTFSPLDRIIEASEKIGEGNLSYRIEYGKRDDFAKVAAAFNTMAARLSGYLSGQRELLHFISHELRTPLSRIRLALELKNTDRARGIIREEVAEIDAMVGEVSDLSHLDDLYRRMNREAVDLNDLITELVSKMGDERISMSLPLTPVRVLCNRLLMERAFSNLIDNALKYSREAEQVYLSLRREDDSCLFRIENSGPGLGKKEIDRIWEPFFRGVAGKTAGVAGRGLGLVIVKRAVELCGGRAMVQSSEEGPTVFTLHIPVHHEEE
jgi:signal transduction histidine kinase